MEAKIFYGRSAHLSSTLADKHMFSIVLKSNEFIKNFTLSNSGGGILIEGFLGELRGISVSEGVMLQLDGANGTLRLDLDQKRLKALLTRRAVFHNRKEKGRNKT